ncbi:hypothetical protein QLQ12_13560 [Actinoplanes sp. NEAU-A12]|uniref:Uncharacterized protein n=1 Tax=Actinoplanes sandaracinus TaxID=3045177 RepID=A0ABT6WIS5_9ACTN|nr:hypothetical protein [Actinoplanes sandaracinus]MDI6099624.1 hypothetical protein [Actinoplanes sandaracinus]
MKLNNMLTIPSMLPTAACTLPVLLPATAAPSAWLAAERIQVELVRALPTAAMRVSAPQVHQVQTQAELGNAALVHVAGNNGTTGFKGSNSVTSSKRYTDGGSGVPPRGRPV